MSLFGSPWRCSCGPPSMVPRHTGPQPSPWMPARYHVSKARPKLRGCRSSIEEVEPAGACGPASRPALKVPRKKFFEQFILCFFPAWDARFEFQDIDLVGGRIPEAVVVGSVSEPVPQPDRFGNLSHDPALVQAQKTCRARADWVLYREAVPQHSPGSRSAPWGVTAVPRFHPVRVGQAVSPRPDLYHPYRVA